VHVELRNSISTYPTIPVLTINYVPPTSTWRHLNRPACLIMSLAGNMWSQWQSGLIQHTINWETDKHLANIPSLDMLLLVFVMFSNFMCVLCCMLYQSWLSLTSHIACEHMIRQELRAALFKCLHVAGEGGAYGQYGYCRVLIPKLYVHVHLAWSAISNRYARLRPMIITRSADKASHYWFSGQRSFQ